ncbi:lysoplasmalogenase [Kribbella sp. NPDC026611]|uniref:lysoplasmalogenase n=1 Tax=Kribbella sp. NPDC026611 TaxID=3154911 RepID=UPI0033D8FACE
MKRANGWRAAYAVLSVAQLITIALDISWLQLVSVALLMPTLAVWARLTGGPVAVLVALVASWVGDVLLQLDHLLPGMAAFGVAHVCYVVLFVRRAQRRSLVVLAAYGVIWAVALVLLWSGLGDDRIPVAVYALLVTATAVTSGWNGWRPGLGGALFLVSDALIGVGLAGHDFTARGYLVMATYCLAQYLLVRNVRPRLIR